MLNRVEGLANHPLGYKPRNAKDFRKIIPLHELIAAAYSVSQLNSVKINNAYNELIKNFGNEFNVLLNVDEGELKKAVHEKLAKVIMMNRDGSLRVKPGYDGVYGKVMLEDNERIINQKKLGEF